MIYDTIKMEIIKIIKEKYFKNHLYISWNLIVFIYLYKIINEIISIKYFFINNSIYIRN